MRRSISFFTISNALKKLMADKTGLLTHKQALDEISGLSYDQLETLKALAKASELSCTQSSIFKRCNQHGLRINDLFSEEFKKIQDLIIQGTAYYDNFFELILETLCVLLSDANAPLTALDAFSLLAKYQCDDPALHVLKEMYPHGFRRKDYFNGDAKYIEVLNALLLDSKNPLTLEKACNEMNGLSIEECLLLKKIFPYGGRKEHVQHFSAQYPDKYLHRIPGHFPAAYFEHYEKHVEKFIELIRNGVDPDRAIRETEALPHVSMATLFAPRVQQAQTIEPHSNQLARNSSASCLNLRSTPEW